MDEELAKDMSYIALGEALKKEPDRNDFIYPIQHATGTYNAIWTRDINVNNPEWHFSLQKLSK